MKPKAMRKNAITAFLLSFGNCLALLVVSDEEPEEVDGCCESGSGKS